MQRTIIFTVILVTCVFCSQTSAQEVSLLASGGYSFYGSLYSSRDPASGGGSESWKAGPLLGLGVRLKATQTFFYGATVEYATHAYHSSEVEGNPTNTIFDVTAFGRATFHILGPISGAFSFGLSYWNQTVDKVVWPEPNPVTRPGQSASGLGFLLGLGLGTQVTDRIEVDLDANAHFRPYGTAVLQMGIAYRVD